MRKITKLVILFSAFLMSFLAFSLIASSYVQTIKIGRKAGFHIISNHMAMKAKNDDYPVKFRTSDIVRSSEKRNKGC